MRNNFFLLGALLLLTTTVLSQMPQRGRGNAPMGRFYGKIVDASNKGIEAASVTLVQKQVDSATKETKEGIVGGMLTTPTGDFSIENVPAFGRYTLRVTGIGFKTVERNVAFQLPNRNGNTDPSALMSALDKDLGNIKLEIDDKLLGNVTVTGNRPAMQMGIDRKVFNVENNIVSAGGSAIDVLKNVPTVSVDIDGNVSVRNSAPQIFVDGRPTNMTLEQIPADAIESIEVITNPSAKFDASGGTAGILNIVLKKTKRVGYSGTLRANIDSRARVGFGGNGNIRQNKVNLFAQGMYNQRKSIGEGTTDRTDIRFSTPMKTLQYDENVMTGAFGFGRVGFDYFMDNRNTLTLSGSMARGTMRPNVNSDIFSQRVVNGQLVDSLFERNSFRKNEFRNYGGQASFKHNFPKTGHEWTADITYNKGRNESRNDIITNYYGMPGRTFNYNYTQLQTSGGENDNLIVQTDYVNPLGENSKLELGLRTFIRNVQSSTTYYSVNPDGSLSTKANQNIEYSSRDNVHAAYANFANRIKSFGYQLGLRIESSQYEGLLANTKEQFNIDFPVSLFPSVFLSQKLGENDDLQFNYSRRINRPNFWQLFPFYDLSDSLYITRGNANLNPEFTNSFELSYSKNFKNRDNLLFSAYFKNTNDLITRIQTVEYVPVIDTQALVFTFANANKSYITGLELTARNRITKWWEVISNANLFTSKIDLKEEEDPEQFLSYFLRLNNNFRLPKNFSVQISADYNSKRLVVASGGGGGGGGFGGGRGGGGFGGGGGGFGPMAAAQGFIRPQFEMDAAIRFEFLKDRAASISLNVNDVLKTRKFSSYSEAAGFVQDIRRIRDQQVFRLNFNWRFGKFDTNIFKRRNAREDNEPVIEGPGF